MNQPERQVYYNVDLRILDKLITEIKIAGEFEDKKYVPTSDNCHFVRYNFIHNKEKTSVVFDTKAEMLTVTAYPDALAKINEIYKQVTDALPKVAAAGSVPKATERNRKKGLEKPNDANESRDKSSAKNKTADVAQKLNVYANDARKPSFIESATENCYISYNPQDMLRARAVAMRVGGGETKQICLSERKPRLPVPNRPVCTLPVPAAKTAADTRNGSGSVENHGSDSSAAASQKSAAVAQKKSDRKNNSEPKQAKLTGANVKPAQAGKKKEPVVAKVEDGIKIDLPEYKNGYSVKKISDSRVENILKQLKDTQGIRVQVIGTISPNTPNELKTYSIEDAGKQKVYIRHITRKNILQLQGKRSNLFGEIQVLISKDSGYKAAVDSHIEFVGDKKQSKTVDKQLKKVLPDAYEFLSEQAKIDFTIGLIDIGNENVKLSDYSVLLVPPYRGLEKLLFDLQRARGIEVKMIGQAFEKDEANNYTLKSGYAKKLNSVVYNEAMCALYIEYFEKRNFYAHTDNSEGNITRIISDKQQAKVIFNNLLSVVNYNCKKLQEIGFLQKKQ